MFLAKIAYFVLVKRQNKHGLNFQFLNLQFSKNLGILKINKLFENLKLIIENYELLKRNFFLFFSDIIYYIKTVHAIDIKGI